jgi:hypothetical protein
MTGLSTYDLNRVLHGNVVTKRTFLGTFPACITPRTRKTFYSFITNSEEHSEAGEHWNAWIIDGRTITFFDSFARNPTNSQFPEHYRDLIKKFDLVRYVSKRVQSFKSVFCGHFCIHFVYIMSLGLKVESFLEDYSDNYDKNDDIVLSIVSQL